VSHHPPRDLHALLGGQPGDLVACPFPATLHGRRVQVTAVLERVAVFEEHGERAVANQKLIRPDGPLVWLERRRPGWNRRTVFS
jgi:hypothetical protein